MKIKFKNLKEVENAINDNLIQEGTRLYNTTRTYEVIEINEYNKTIETYEICFFDDDEYMIGYYIITYKDIINMEIEIN